MAKYLYNSYLKKYYKLCNMLQKNIFKIIFFSNKICKKIKSNKLINQHKKLINILKS